MYLPLPNLSLWNNWSTFCQISYFTYFYMNWIIWILSYDFIHLISITNPRLLYYSMYLNFYDWTIFHIRHYHFLCVDLYIDGHLDSFHRRYKANLNVLKDSVMEYVSFLAGNIPRSKIASKPIICCLMNCPKVIYCFRS